MDRDSAPARIEIVVPLYNERDVIEVLYDRLVSVCRRLDACCSLVFVDDGSHDGTTEWIRQVAIEQRGDGPPTRLIELSRNFGQPAAIEAGLHCASGADAIVLMDGDLQDPPELIPELLSAWHGGADVVIARRTRRQEAGLRKWLFYGFHYGFRLVSDLKFPAHTGTFCLLNQRAATTIGKLPEAHRFFPGMRAWVGFRQEYVDYRRPDRAAGTPKQTLRRLVGYACDAVFGYSRKPLRLVTWVGGVTFLLAMVAATWLVAKRVLGWEEASMGFTTLACAIFGLGGVQLIGIGILGEYIGRIYEQVKCRPRYLIQRDSDTTAVPGGEVTIPMDRSTDRAVA